MKLAKLAQALFRWMTILLFLLAFVWLDWLPTVRELGGLRRDQSDLKRKIKEHSAMSERFTFPDAEERALIARSGVELQRALPKVETDAVWLDTVLRALTRQVGEDHVIEALFLTSPDPDSAPGEPAAQNGKTDDLGSWLVEQRREILRNFHSETDHGRFPWRFLFADLGNLKGQGPASRPLVLALAAPLPALLNFINRISWRESRLEIVRLHLEPGAVLSRAWMILRGDYLVRGPSPWVMPEVTRNDAGLLVDLDSPILWLKVNLDLAPQIPRNDLPPGAGTASLR